MDDEKIIKKPALTFLVIIIIIGAIIYIELQKPDITDVSKASANQENSSLQNSSNSSESFSFNNPNREIINQKSAKYIKAPDFAGIANWLNSKPLSISQLKGKVVLVDFWTYTCINCIRTLPYVTSWDEKYKNKGLVIIGVHTPEFEFEKKSENVQNAINEHNIKYPVAQDNNYATWQAYQNRYWPRKYLIDIDGFIVYDHAGEGNYEETEAKIQELLKERGERMNENKVLEEKITKPEKTVEVNFAKIHTPEIYFGYQFFRGNFGNPEGIKPDEIIDYKTPSQIIPNQVYLSGKWKNNVDNMELAGDNGKIVLKFHAKKANIVAGSETGSELKVSVDSKLAEEKTSVKEFKLYNLVSADSYGSYDLEIDVKGKGFKIYTFTFG